MLEDRMTHATTKNQMSQDTCTDYTTAVPMLQKPVHCIDFPRQGHAIKGGIEKGKEMNVIHPPCEARVGAHVNSGNIAHKGSHWDISKLNVDHVSRCLLDMLFRLLSQRGSTFETQKS